MGDDTTQYDRVCKDEFKEIKAMITKLDEAIRGNGKEGLTTRMTRAEIKANDNYKFLVGISRAVVGISTAIAVMLLGVVGRLIYNYLVL